jgi:hypothetical protein
MPTVLAIEMAYFKRCFKKWLKNHRGEWVVIYLTKGKTKYEFDSSYRKACKLAKDKKFKPPVFITKVTDEKWAPICIFSGIARAPEKHSRKS